MKPILVLNKHGLIKILILSLLITFDMMIRIKNKAITLRKPFLE